MGRVVEIPYRTWDDFKGSLVGDLFGARTFTRGAFVFRGQSSADWKLVSSFDRWTTRGRRADRFGSTSRNDVARAMLDHFRHECQRLDELSGFPWADDVKALALGQHYGLPTRLLDWSESPYVAAFFAFHDALLEDLLQRHVAIWALRTDHEIWATDQVEIVNVPSIGNLRLRNQAGKFTLLKSDLSCLEDYANSFGDGPPALWKLILPAEEAQRAIADLDAMGINSAHTYPELTGYTSAAVIRVLLAYPLDRDEPGRIPLSVRPGPPR